MIYYTRALLFKKNALLIFSSIMHEYMSIIIRSPGKKPNFFLKILEKKKLKKSFPTDKLSPNGQIF